MAIIRIQCAGVPQFRIHPIILVVAGIAFLVGSVGIIDNALSLALGHDPIASHFTQVSFAKDNLPERPIEKPSDEPTMCDYLADGVGHLNAELSTAFFEPSAESNVLNLHYLVDAQKNTRLSEDTRGQIESSLEVVHQLFALQNQPGENRDVQKTMVLKNLDTSLRDVSASIQRDCSHR